MSESRVKKCPKCGGKPERLISGGSALIFKGSGFYITDYKKQKTEDRGQKTEDRGQKTEEKSQKKETKPEPKAETKKESPPGKK